MQLCFVVMLPSFQFLVTETQFLQTNCCLFFQISEGAECIMINKRFFLMNASITTLVQLKALVCASCNVNLYATETGVKRLPGTPAKLVDRL